MTTPSTLDRASADARRAWVIGGALLIASAVIGLLARPGGAPIPGGRYIESALFSASMLIFAFGIRGSGSVTARRPLGTSVLVALAVWTLVEPVLVAALQPRDPVFDDSFGPTSGLWPLIVLSYVDVGVRFLLALLAATQIARSGTVAPPWNWAPTWVVAATAGSWLLAQIIGFDSSLGTGFLSALIALEGLVVVGGPVFLGVLAIILANLSGRTRTTPIYPEDS